MTKRKLISEGFHRVGITVEGLIGVAVLGIGALLFFPLWGSSVPLEVTYEKATKLAGATLLASSFGYGIVLIIHWIVEGFLFGSASQEDKECKARIEPFGAHRWAFYSLRDHRMCRGLRLASSPSSGNWLASQVWWCNGGGFYLVGSFFFFAGLVARRWQDIRLLGPTENGPHKGVLGYQSGHRP